MTEATQLNAGATNGQPAPSLDLTGRTLGDYQVLRRLGRGGMGEVYLAEQRSLKRKVALKILRGDLAANPTAVKRFKYEAEAVAKATHANIVQVYACDEVDGVTYMALEYVEGRTLKEFFIKKGPPELSLAISFMRQIAAALQRASELGIIHRDIKPENILLTRKGEVKVADFGLSRVLDGDQPAVHLTQSGMTLGTPLYMAPEQVEGKAVDPRTDIYSFGVTCYYMMAGTPPFTGNTAFEVALAHIRSEAEPLQKIRPDLPEAFCAVIHKMMAKDPADRYQTCRELLKELNKVREGITSPSAAVKGGDQIVELQSLDDLETVTPTMSGSNKTMYQSQSLALLKKNWWLPVVLVVAAGTVFVALVGGGLLAWWRFGSSDKTATATTTPNGGPTEQAKTEAIFDTQQREKVLRDEVDKALNSPNVGRNSSTGLTACIELASFYLDQNKLEDARTLFTRLGNIPRPADPRQSVDSYHFLGHLGNAIVLALSNKASDSNAAFKDAFSEEHGFRFPLRGGGKGKDVRPEPRSEPHTQVLQNPRIRYWLAQAIHFNEKNGVQPADMPFELRNYANPDEAPPK